MAEAKIKSAIHSTDFSSLHLPLLEADDAAIEMYKKQQQSKMPHAADKKPTGQPQKQNPLPRNPTQKSK